jgi:PleD family two-component response regulator
MRSSASKLGTVLVVDDDRRSVDILCRLLALDGIEAVGETSGEAALALAAARDFDCVLLDVMMPELDGLEVCVRLRAQERTRSIPVILLTGKDDEATRAAGMRLGVSEFLAKPVVKHELWTRVRTQLRARARVCEIDATLAKL